MSAVPVPIVIVGKFDLKLGASYQADAKVTANLGFTSTFNSSAGVEYKNDTLTPIKSFDYTFNPYMEIDNGVVFTARPYLRPKISLLLYNVAGPYLDVRPYGKGSVVIDQDPNLETGFGITGNTGGELTILSKVLASFNVELFDFNYPGWTKSIDNLVPNAPSNLQATTVLSSQIDLIWTDHSSYEDGFKVERKAGANGIYSQIATIAANNTSYADTNGLQSKTLYCYRVRAYKGTKDSVYSNESCTTTEKDKFVLSIIKAGTGTGTVTSSPAGISCGADCSEPYNSSTVVTLTATPAADSTFSGWSGGGCTGTGTCTVTMSASTSVTATFKSKNPTLTVTKAGTGSGTITSSPAGISCGADCSEPYNSSTVVTLTATPAEDSTFAGWSGGGCTGTGTCTITIDTGTAVTATFNSKNPTLTIIKAGTGTGTVTSIDGLINCGATCSASYNSGDSVTLTAIADVGSRTAGWSGDADCTDGIVTMDASKTCIATFNLLTLTITKAGTGTGTVTSSPAGINCGADCSEPYINDTVVTLTATPDPDSTFIGWSGGGCTGTETCIVTMNASKTITATFSSSLANTFLKVVKAGTGTGIVTSSPAGISCGADCSEFYNIDTVVTLTATPSADSTFSGWSGGGCTGTGTCTVTMNVAFATTKVTATFNVTSAAGTWIATGSMATRREFYTATLLPDGKVLVAGGRNGLTALATAELYDPATGTWSVTGSMVTPRNLHAAALLPNGKVLVGGGKDGGQFNSLNSAELYDPATGIWTATGSMELNAHPEFVLLPNGKVLDTYGNPELYDPATGLWKKTGNLRDGRYIKGAATLLLDGTVLLAGGCSKYSSCPSTMAHLYNPATDLWSSTGSMATATVDHTATLLLDGKVLVAGGWDFNNIATFMIRAELYDPATGTWSATGSMAKARSSHTATLLTNGKVLVVPGSELYDPATGTWSNAGNIAIGETATLLLDGNVLVTGDRAANLFIPQALAAKALLAGSDNNDQGGSSSFGCGGIDIQGHGPKGPSDFGGLGSLMAIMSLPFILRWRKKCRGTCNLLLR